MFPTESPTPPDGRVLAALAVLGWPDDRERSAHIEEDGYEVTPVGHYWSIVCDVLAAADLAAELNLRAEVARVRADVAGAITADLQAARRAAAAPASMESLDRALRIVARHAVAPTESVVGAPTPISAPSDVAAPRDALTDQDFADLRAAVASARLTEVEYGLRRDDRDSVAQYGSRAKAEYWASVSQPGWELVCRQVGPWRPVERMTDEESAEYSRQLRDTAVKAGWVPCCDMHNAHCEPPSELCCGSCTEVAHDMFPTPHADGSACVLDAATAAEVGALPEDEGTRIATRVSARTDEEFDEALAEFVEENDETPRRLAEGTRQPCCAEFARTGSAHTEACCWLGEEF